MQLIPSTHTHKAKHQNNKSIRTTSKEEGKITAAKPYMCHIRKYMSREAAGCRSIIKQSSRE